MSTALPSCSYAETISLHMDRSSSCPSDNVPGLIGFPIEIAPLNGVLFSPVSYSDSEQTPHRIKQEFYISLFRKTVQSNLDRLLQVKESKEEIMFPCGEQCDEPYGCWYKDYCRGLRNNN